MKSAITLVLYLTITASVFANDALVPALTAAEERDYKLALQSLSSLPDEQKDRDVMFHLARVQYLSGDYDTAADTLEDLHSHYPDDADAYYLSGLVYLALVSEVNIFKKVGMANKTLASWEASVAADPGHLNSRYAIFAYYTNAPSIAGGDLEVARELMDEIAELDKAYGAMAKGLLLSKEKDAAGAEAAFQEATVLMNRAGPYFSLAQFYMQTEQYEKAISSVQEFQEREKRWWDPDITVAHLVIAQANAELGNEELARQEANMGLSLNPNKQIKKMLKDTLKSL